MGTSVQRLPPDFARSSDDEDDAAVMGLALDTRNYRALLGRTAAATDDHDHAEEEVATGVAVATGNYQALLGRTSTVAASPTSDDSGFGDDAVATGVAVATGNYQALLGASRAAASPTVSSDDSGFGDDLAVGVAVATGNYHALLGQARTSRSSSVSHGDDGFGDDAVATGVAVATGNYQALLGRPSSTAASPSVAAPSDSGVDEDADVATGVAVTTRNYQALLGGRANGAASPSRNSDGINDNTVVGMAISTRNYEALVHGRDIAPPNHNNNHQQQRATPTHHNNNNQRDHRRDQHHHHTSHRDAAPSPSRHHRFSTPHHEAQSPARSPAPAPRRYSYDRTGSTTSSSLQSPVAVGVAVERPRRASNQRETETINEDEDAVLGLPISTGNYRDMYPRSNGNRANANARQRSYSGLAGPVPDRPSVDGRRSAPDYRIAAQSTTGSTAGQSTDSCFDTRRTSGAVVPHKGWLYIQSNTMRAWKRYFAVLSGLDFRYSPEPGRASKGFGMVQSIERWDGKPWGIKLVYTSGNPVHAYCGNEQDREEWINQVTKSLDKLQNSNDQSRTTYTLAADQHEGYLYKQDHRTKRWVLTFFTLRNDGYMQCRDDARSPADARSSGYVRSIAFADVHTNALAIELASGESVFVYTDSYDDRMLWYAAISALASANSKVPSSARLVKSSYIQTALPNHSGWLFKPMGLFKSWKRVYCTLHGLEFGFAKDVNSAAEEVGKICGVKDWDGKQHGLEVRFASGASWKLHAESYETAKHWRSVISEVCRHADRFNIKSYLASRRRKKMRPVFGGWLTTHKGSTRVRRFYVADGNMLGVADDVDNLLQPIGNVVDLGATRDTTNGMLMTFADGSRLKISGDSVESAKAWYDCISASV